MGDCAARLELPPVWRWATGLSRTEDGIDAGCVRASQNGTNVGENRV